MQRCWGGPRDSGVDPHPSPMPVRHRLEAIAGQHCVLRTLIPSVAWAGSSHVRLIRRVTAGQTKGPD